MIARLICFWSTGNGIMFALVAGKSGWVWLYQSTAPTREGGDVKGLFSRSAIHV